MSSAVLTLDGLLLYNMSPTGLSNTAAMSSSVDILGMAGNGGAAEGVPFPITMVWLLLPGTRSDFDKGLLCDASTSGRHSPIILGL